MSLRHRAVNHWRSLAVAKSDYDPVTDWRRHVRSVLLRDLNSITLGSRPGPRSSTSDVRHVAATARTPVEA